MGATGLDTIPADIQAYMDGCHTYDHAVDGRVRVLKSALIKGTHYAREYYAAVEQIHGAAIVNEMRAKDEFWEAMEEILGLPEPSLEKPPLPNELDKNLQNIESRFLRPLSFQE